MFQVHVANGWNFIEDDGSLAEWVNEALEEMVVVQDDGCEQITEGLRIIAEKGA